MNKKRQGQSELARSGRPEPLSQRFGNVDTSEGLHGRRQLAHESRDFASRSIGLAATSTKYNNLLGAGQRRRHLGSNLG